MLCREACKADGVTEKAQSEHINRLLRAIRKELDEDPTSVGYKNKKDEAVTMLLNAPVEKPRDDKKVPVEYSACRTSYIIAGIPYAPNALTPQHIAAARALTPEV